MPIFKTLCKINQNEWPGNTENQYYMGSQIIPKTARSGLPSSGISG
jgi:hypothetical protein